MKHASNLYRVLDKTDYLISIVNEYLRIVEKPFYSWTLSTYFAGLVDKALNKLKVYIAEDEYFKHPPLISRLQNAISVLADQYEELMCLWKTKQS